MPQATTGKRKKSAKAPKLSRLFRPTDMSLEDWQTQLRRQFGREQDFKIRALQNDSVFGDYEIHNPKSLRQYRVSIRGTRPGENRCTCPDFTTNALGTCKHIEFALAKLERRSHARSALRRGFNPPYSEVMLRYGARRQVVFSPGTECPPALQVLAADYFGADRTLLAESFGRFEQFVTKASVLGHDLRLHEDVLGFIAEVRDGEKRRKRIDQAFPSGIRSTAFNGLLKASLYDYQKQGALFAARAGRCLIGDEMGLGKTIQAIAAAEIMAKQLGVQRVLIICPTSLKHQWESEIAKFTRRTSTVISGLLTRRTEKYAEPSFFKISNYDTIHRDLDLIANWSPDLVILDEAQRIKNWSTRVARSVKAVVSPFAIVLTGTPLENRLEELVSIVQFVDQHCLGPTYRFLADHQLQDEHGKVVGYQNLDTIGKTLEPILIRRQKKEVVKQLPERIDKNFFVPMTPEQMAHHEENRDAVARIVAKWRRYRYLSEADQRRLMICLQNMRMSCNSTYLLDQETDFGVKADELTTLMSDLFEQQKSKVVIFSQWVRTHELIRRRFEKRKWKHVIFHGGVPGEQRKHLIDRFREDDQCQAFLSTDAGGVGLNLQHASVVVNMDLPWNPAVLEQRIGRVHRLGQNRQVQVFNFVSQGTIEEGMLSLLKFKKSLFSGALDGGDKEVFLGGSRLKRFIDTVEKASGAIPPASIEVQPAADDDSSTDVEIITPTPAKPPRDPLSELLETGVSLLKQVLSPGASQGGSEGLSFIHRDERTGEQYVRFPVPKQEVLEKAMTAVASLVELLRPMLKK